MLRRRMLTFILISCALSVATASAQPGDRYLDMKARVLDLVFPIGVSAKPYNLRLVFRYGDTDSQLVVVVHPGKKYWQREYDVFRYSLIVAKQGQISQLISEMEKTDPKVTPQEIAAKLRVRVVQSTVDPRLLKKALGRLGKVNLPAALPSQVCVDECPQYEFTYDTWQDYVHYVMTDPPPNTPEGRLVEWMIKFREDLPGMLTQPWVSQH